MNEEVKIPPFATIKSFFLAINPVCLKLNDKELLCTVNGDLHTMGYEERPQLKEALETWFEKNTMDPDGLVRHQWTQFAAKAKAKKNQAKATAQPEITEEDLMPQGTGSSYHRLRDSSPPAKNKKKYMF